MRNATRLTVATFGGLAGLVGVEHAIGDLLQGSIAPPALVFQSWPDSPFFRIMDGEPAMTLIPNLLVSGLLAALFSLAYLIVAVWYADRRYAGLGLILLSLIMLLVGAGFGPPLLGIIIGLTATRLHAPNAWSRAHLPPGLQRSLTALWPWSYGAALAAWLLLFPGLNLLDTFIGLPDSYLTAYVTFSALGLLIMTILTGFVHDAQRQPAGLRAAPV